MTRGTFQIAESLADSGLSLPMGPNPSLDQAAYVVKTANPARILPESQAVVQELSK